MKKYFLIIPFVVLSLIASFVNYITYPILARVLPDVQFVDVAVALSLLTQVSSFLTSVVALSIAYTKHEEKDPTKALEILQSSLVRSFVVLIIIFTAASPLIINRIHLAPILVVPIVMLMIFSIPVSVISGYLNGKRRMFQLGLVVVVTSVAQFAFAITAALVTRNGSPTLNSMAIGQLAGVIILYILFRHEGLPRLSTIFARHHKQQRSEIARYALLASIGVMAISILQILDLLIIKSYQVDQRLYTDLSIVSRLVFFSGTIFIWPFLGSIDIKNRRYNFLLITKLLALFIFIGGVAVTGISLYGDKIINLLTGSEYPISTVRAIGIPAILFKIFFLIATALVLYFIVLKDRLAIVYPLIVTGLFLIAVKVGISPHGSTQKTIVILDITAGVSVLIGLALVARIATERGSFSVKNEMRVGG